MIKPKCIICKKELKDFGAILLSPPVKDHCGIDSVDKYHVCRSCWVKKVAALW